MNTELYLDFTEIGTVKATAPISGRGIKYLCTQLNGMLVYSITEAAEKALIKKHGATYTNDNGNQIAA